MSPQRPSRSPLSALLVALMVIPPIAFFAALPWLKQQPDWLGLLVSGVAAMLTIAASFALAVIHERRQDEWHRSGARFSSQWGWTSGASLVALLLAAPPFRDFIVSFVGRFARSPPDYELVVFAFTLGFMAVVFAQVACTLLISVGWTRRMSRGPREP